MLDTGAQPGAQGRAAAQAAVRHVLDRALGSQAMLFFDPTLKTIFGSGSDAMKSVLAEEGGIERLMERLEEIDEEPGFDA